MILADSIFCLRTGNVLQDYEKCFEGMIGDNRFRNVISKMFSGNYAYNPRSRVCWDSDSEHCNYDLRSVVHGACNVNYITMW